LPTKPLTFFSFSTFYSERREFHEVLDAMKQLPIRLCQL